MEWATEGKPRHPGGLAVGALMMLACVGATNYLAGLELFHDAWRRASLDRERHERGKAKVPEDTKVDPCPVREQHLSWDRLRTGSHLSNSGTVVLLSLDPPLGGFGLAIPTQKVFARLQGLSPASPELGGR